MTEDGRIRINEKQSFVDLEGKRVQGLPQYLQSEEVPVDSSWTDLKGYTWRWKYPTEVSEEILHRVISSSSSKGDLVLDVFAGSGTTGAVAEKMGRKWILADASKMAIHVITRRLFSLKKRIGNKGRWLKPGPFVLLNSEGFNETRNNSPSIKYRVPSQAANELVIEDIHLSEESKIPQDIQSSIEGLDYVLLGFAEEGNSFRVTSLIAKKDLQKSNWRVQITDDIRHLIFKDVFGNSALYTRDGERVTTN
jgi:hypothetical protein